MGTIISLAVGRLEVDWGKNSFFSDHGALFQTTDLKPVPSYSTDEDDPDGEISVEEKPGFGKRLRHVTARLELLGYTLRAVEHEYAELHRLHGFQEQAIPFSELSEALATVDVQRVSGRYSGDYEAGEFVRTEILERLALNSDRHRYHPGDPRPDYWEISLLLENFGANAALRMLAQNPMNLDLDVSWDFTPLVEAGWATEDQFHAGALPAQRFLVVTEGRSDANIIRHGLALYRPYVSDFFQFVDMEEGYPFSGTGNQYRFSQGLASIGIQNNTIILYDNDAEGTAQLRKTRRLTLPVNLRATQLPPLEDLSHFPTVGPHGSFVADVNGKAGAIECYLDLRRPGLPEPLVRWTSYNSEIGQYHGVLEHKNQFVRDFLSLRRADPAYDSRKIEAVLDALIAECVAIAEAKHMSTIPAGR